MKLEMAYRSFRKQFQKAPLNANWFLPGGAPKLGPGNFRDYVALYPRPDEPLLSLKVTSSWTR